MVSYPVPTFQELVEEFVQKYMRDTTLDTQKMRRDIMERAREYGIEDEIPENWNEDGTLKVTPGELPPMRERLPHEAG
jgi:hypothetical protein